MATRKILDKKIKKYKEEIGQLAGEKETERTELRKFRKRLKRSQRKLASRARNEERLSGGAKKKSKSSE